MKLVTGDFGGYNQTGVYCSSCVRFCLGTALLVPKEEMKGHAPG